jgi:hypothetical protein
MSCKRWLTNRSKEHQLHNLSSNALFYRQRRCMNDGWMLCCWRLRRVLSTIRSDVQGVTKLPLSSCTQRLEGCRQLPKEFVSTPGQFTRFQSATDNLWSRLCGHNADIIDSQHTTFLCAIWQQPGRIGLPTEWVRNITSE